ncbi:hypothetical protein KSP40_PGU005558 [Platanthera guangdongensis]|uniref:Uncharacterized protein n=1 Tax=Platanthera guangdongensis TaxID=2320717 RepID=A0ABR2LQI8_9ASPA
MQQNTMTDWLGYGFDIGELQQNVFPSSSSMDYDHCVEMRCNDDLCGWARMEPILPREPATLAAYPNTAFPRNPVPLTRSVQNVSKLYINALEFGGSLSSSERGEDRVRQGMNRTISGAPLLKSCSNCSVQIAFPPLGAGRIILARATPVIDTFRKDSNSIATEPSPKFCHSQRLSQLGVIDALGQLRLHPSGLHPHEVVLAACSSLTPRCHDESASDNKYSQVRPQYEALSFSPKSQPQKLNYIGGLLYPSATLWSGSLGYPNAASLSTSLIVAGASKLCCIFFNYGQASQSQFYNQTNAGQHPLIRIANIHNVLAGQASQSQLEPKLATERYYRHAIASVGYDTTLYRYHRTTVATATRCDRHNAG